MTFLRFLATAFDRFMRRSFAAAMLLAAACGGDVTGVPGSTPIASITLGVYADTVLVRETFTATARTAAADGVVLTDRPITWVSSDSTILRVTPGGSVTALRGGTATLTASSAAVSATHQVFVRALHFTSVYAGPAVTCGAEATGDLWCWGNVPATGFGNGSSLGAPSPLPRRAATGHRFSALAIGSDFACGIELGGGVVCWGGNDHGQLGDGSRSPHYSPAAVTGAPASTAVVVGDGHACALGIGGQVYCWGSNSEGQLGDGTTNDGLTAAPVPGLSGVSALSAGYGHNCALIASGPVCWGFDGSGQLGHDTTYDRLVPVRAGATPVLAPSYSGVTANDNHACGLSDGAPYCWGTFRTNAGPVELGLFDVYTVSNSPVVQAPGHLFAKLSDGWIVQCGLEIGGDLYCWTFGHPPSRFPSAMPLTDAAVWADVPCALDTAGTVRCWNRRDPPIVLTGVPPLTRVAGSSNYVCGLAADATVWCWNSLSFAGPARLASGATAFSSIWGGDDRACALTAAGDAWCVAPNGMLAPSAAGYSLVAVSSGRGHTCGLTSAGAALCWGGNAHGQLGDGTRSAHAAPVPVAGGLVFTTISTGDEHSCGGTAAGQVYCWGGSSYGRVGDGNGVNSRTPIAVSGSPALTTLASGGVTTCGLSADGGVLCWPPRIPVAIPARLVKLAVSEAKACGIDPAGNASCWAYDRTTAGWIVTPVGGGLHFATIAAGGSTICGITLGGSTYCWGDNNWQNLGSPDASGAFSATLPLRVFGQE